MKPNDLTLRSVLVHGEQANCLLAALTPRGRTRVDDKNTVIGPKMRLVRVTIHDAVYDFIRKLAKQVLVHSVKIERWG